MEFKVFGIKVYLEPGNLEYGIWLEKIYKTDNLFYHVNSYCSLNC
jgi:hypothetical protein